MQGVDSVVGDAAVAQPLHKELVTEHQHHGAHEEPDDAMAQEAPDGAEENHENRYFQAVAHEIDPFLAEHDTLAGVMVFAKAFPGWMNLEAANCQTCMSAVS